MLIRRALTLLVLLILVVPPARAQQISPDTFDVISATPGVEAHIRLINMGASVKVITGGRPLPMRADTLDIPTPVRLIVPASSFSLAVSTATAEPGALMVVRSRTTARAGDPLLATTFYSPFTLLRDSTRAGLSVNAKQVSSTPVP